MPRPHARTPGLLETAENPRPPDGPQPPAHMLRGPPQATPAACNATPPAQTQTLRRNCHSRGPRAQ
eukprot:3241549-Lingulodinium_polyedra.AAC.1